MSNAKYEGTIGSYSFQMTDETTIEVWGYDNEYPETYIFLKEGSVRTKKDFDYEISDFFFKNLQG